MIYGLVRDRGGFKVRVRFGNRARIMVGYLKGFCQG